MSGLALDQAWAMALLPLALLPVWRHGRSLVDHPAPMLIPPDRWSLCLDLALRLAGAVAVAALVLAVGGLHRPAIEVERLGRGAHMVLLLDRSRSMDMPFASDLPVPPLARSGRESKGRAARRVLAEFVARRHEDMYAMAVFSTAPIPVLPLTAKQEAVRAAIAAGNVGPGLAETDIGAGLEWALHLFDGRPYTGSRILVLVSDGAGELDRDTRRRVAHLARRHRVALYWVYIRTANGPRIDVVDTSGNAAPGPEQALHAYFASLDTPYRHFTAESPGDLQAAIEEVGRLQNLPLRYRDKVPRRDLVGACLALALSMLALLAGARYREILRWRG